MRVILNKPNPARRDTHFKPPKKRGPGYLVPWLMIGALLISPLSTTAGELILNDFSDVSRLTLNGDAKTLQPMVLCYA